MYEFSKEVEVIDWKEEFNIKDKNPEIIDEIEFWEYLLKNNLITEKEFDEKINSLPRVYTSKTLAISFKEINQVSFREEFPSFPVILHELGHCYFKEDDPIWSNTYCGGESIMWLILYNKLEGNEETIKKYHSLLHLGYTNPSELENQLNKIAEILIKKFKLKIDDIEILYPIPDTPLTRLCYLVGWIRDDENPIHLLIEAVEGTRWNDFLWTEFLKTLLTI